MAKKNNLIPGGHKLTLEEQKAGGKASGKARREKATMKATLEMLLDETSKNGKTYRELATLGLLKGAINGNSSNYRAIVELLGELEPNNETITPKLAIEIIDNSNLEKTLYEANQHNKNDDGQ